MNFYVIFGFPGAGKGVSAQNLKEKRGFHHLSMGEYLRKEAKAGTAIGVLNQKEIECGLELIPSEIVCTIIKNELLIAIEQKMDLVIDGFPRTIDQLNFLKALARSHEIQLIFIHLLVDVELSIQRLITRKTCKDCSHDFIMTEPTLPNICDLCGGELYIRSTDNRKTILKRIDFFEKTTQYVIKKLESEKILITVDANKPLDLLVDDIFEIDDAQHKKPSDSPKI